MKVYPALVVSRNDQVIPREREANTSNLPRVSHERISIISLLGDEESEVLKGPLDVLDEQKASGARQTYERRKRRSTVHET